MSKSKYTRYIDRNGDCKLPKRVTSIGEGAFKNCSDLTSITIPNSVTSIRNDAFCGCKNLKSITIPDSVTLIGKYAFRKCSSLKKVTCPERFRNLFPEDCQFVNLEDLNESYSLAAPVDTQSTRERMGYYSFGNDILGKDISVIAKDSRYGRSSMATSPLGDSTLRSGK